MKLFTGMNEDASYECLGERHKEKGWGASLRCRGWFWLKEQDLLDSLTVVNRSVVFAICEVKADEYHSCWMWWYAPGLRVLRRTFMYMNQDLVTQIMWSTTMPTAVPPSRVWCFSSAPEGQPASVPSALLLCMPPIQALLTWSSELWVLLPACQLVSLPSALVWVEINGL